MKRLHIGLLSGFAIALACCITALLLFDLANGLLMVPWWRPAIIYVFYMSVCALLFMAGLAMSRHKPKSWFW
jgi:hypothetical protein